MLLPTTFIIFVVVFGVKANEYGSSLTRTLSDHDMKLSQEAGYSYVDRLAQLEEDLFAKGQYLKEDSPFYKMALFKRPSQEARELSRKASRMLAATRYLKEQLRMSNEEERSELEATLRFTVINDTCLTETTCSSSYKYRKIDGSCNSLTTTNLGKANTDYRRLTTPSYADGIESIRLASNGSALPGARAISVELFGGLDKPLTTATLAVMQFGQLINHDFQQSTTFTFSNGTDISCCSSTGQNLDASELHSACLPIAIASDDKIINRVVPKGQEAKTCMNFVRSIAGPRLDCSLGYADQLNQNTHWLDASTVYGSSDATLATLREYSGGLLKTTKDTTNNRELLPVTSSCTTGACFYAGDSRATEQPQLTVMHTIWHREHNRIAKKLSALNPTWSDESIFQEARRILIAEMQHITYNEFIPMLLSSTFIKKYSLSPLTSGYFTNYSSISTGPVSNEFSTAAFRMGHSLVQGSVLLYDESGNQLDSSYTMADTFNDASKIINDNTYFDAVIRGLLIQPSQMVDIQVDDSLWNRMFRETGESFGFDVVALNIQRGRDHGLPSYNTYRQLCGFTKLTSFADMTTSSTSTNPGFKSFAISIISSFYSSVDDIDLYVGGLSELSTSGGNMGGTLSCLIAEHFNKQKYTDRFFYELGGQAHSFSSAQLTEIRKASMARIFCDNSDGTVLSVQPKAFQTISSTNAKTLCTDTTSIPSLDFTAWQGETLF